MGAIWREVRAGVTRRWLSSVLALALFFVAIAAASFAVRSSAAAILPSPTPLRGAQPFATILCKFSDVPGEPVRPAYFDQMMFQGPASLDRYWRDASSGAIDLAGSQAFGWFVLPRPRTSYQHLGQDVANLEDLARDCAGAADARVSFEPFTGVNLVFNDCINRPRGGEMALTLDGRRRRFRVTWLCPGSSISHQIVAHEMGHSFGLTHSSDSSGDEYGNTWDVMSIASYCAPESLFGALAQETIAVNKDLLGWISPDRKFTSAGAGKRSIELVAPEAAGRGFLLAEIPLGRGRTYTVEARVRAGFDRGLPASGVLIHEVDMTR